MRRIAASLAGILVVLTLALAACGGDDDASREDELRETVRATYEEFRAGDFNAFYERFSDEFKRRCPRADFNRLMAFAQVFVGGALGESAVRLGEVRIEGDRGYVELIFVDRSGRQLPSRSARFSEFWVYEDGAWRANTDDPDPCSDEVFDVQPATPAPQPSP